MPKLVTVLGTMVLALLAGPTFAQETPPPAPPPATTEAAAPEAPATTDAPATEEPATTDAPANDAPATTDAPANDAPATTDAPTTTDAPATDAPATQPATAPASQPAAAATQPAGASSQPMTTGGEDADGSADSAAAPALVDSGPKPDVMERRLVAYVSTGVAAVALGAGITLGTIALTQYDCLNNVLVCNDGAEDPILGDEFLDKKAEVETLSLLADMAYVVAAAATIVAVTGYIRGYFLTDEEPAAEVTP